MNPGSSAPVASDRGRAVFFACARRRLALVLAFLAGLGEAAALPLAEPVSRAFTSLDGRKVELTIDGVTEETLEGVRIPGGERVSLPVARLAAGDRAFAAELRTKAEGAQNFSRSPWVDVLAADLWTTDPGAGDTGGLISSQPAHWAGCGYFLVIVAGRLDGGRPLAFPKKLAAERRAGVGIVVLYSAGGAVDAVIHAEAAGAPSGFLREDKVRAVRRVVLDLEREMSTAARPKAGDPPVYRTQAFGSECLKRLPGYWPRPPLTAGILDERDPGEPQAYLLRRDGTPARFEGRPVAGRVGDVTGILEAAYARIH